MWLLVSRSRQDARALAGATVTAPAAISSALLTILINERNERALPFHGSLANCHQHYFSCIHYRF